MGKKRGRAGPQLFHGTNFVFVGERGKSLHASFKATSYPAKTRKRQIRNGSQIYKRLIIRKLQGIKPRYTHTYLPEKMNKTHRIPGKAAVPAEHNGHSMLTADSR